MAYPLIAWTYVQYVDSTQRLMTVALELICCRGIFFVLEFMARAAVWHLYGRSKFVDKTLVWLRTHNLPQRYSIGDDFLDYLDRVENDPSLTPTQQLEARCMVLMLGHWGELGARKSAQVYACCEQALEEHSIPRPAFHPILSSTVDMAFNDNHSQPPFIGPHIQNLKRSAKHSPDGKSV